ncbi:MAG TPA: VanZ family protein [Noviherbaspirillum sp.]
MRSLVTRFIPDEHYERSMFSFGLLLYLAVIVFGSIPGARAEFNDVASGVVLHLTAYSCIAFFLAAGTNGSTPRKAVVSFLLVAAMGAVDEGIQSLLPYRHGAVADWGIDLVAGLLTATLFWLASARQSVLQR